MGRACGACIREDKPEGMKPLGRPRHGWEDKIEIHFNGIEWDGMAFIYLAQYEGQWQAIVNCVVKVHIP
jgi:hypothetical protein